LKVAIPQIQHPQISSPQIRSVKGGTIQSSTTEDGLLQIRTLKLGKGEVCLNEGGSSQISELIQAGTKIGFDQACIPPQAACCKDTPQAGAV